MNKLTDKMEKFIRDAYRDRVQQVFPTLSESVVGKMVGSLDMPNASFVENLLRSLGNPTDERTLRYHVAYRCIPEPTAHAVREAKGKSKTHLDELHDARDAAAFSDIPTE